MLSLSHLSLTSCFCAVFGASFFNLWFLCYLCSIFLSPPVYYSCCFFFCVAHSCLFTCTFSRTLYHSLRWQCSQEHWTPEVDQSSMCVCVFVCTRVWVRMRTCAFEQVWQQWNFVNWEKELYALASFSNLTIEAVLNLSVFMIMYLCVKY